MKRDVFYICGCNYPHVSASMFCMLKKAGKIKKPRIVTCGYVMAQEYADMYYGAEGRTPKDKINSIRRARYQQNKDYINVQKRDAYWKRKLVDEKVLTQRLSFNYNASPEFIPLYTIIDNPQAIAGKGTANEIRDVPRLVATYKADESD